jgi:hypothetical protein
VLRRVALRSVAGTTALLFCVGVVLGRAGPPAGKGKVVRVAICPLRIPKPEQQKAAYDGWERAVKKVPSARLIERGGEVPIMVVEFDPAKVDVGDFARALARVKTRGVRKGTPPVALILAATLTERQQGKVAAALKKVKGVDPKKCEYDDRFGLWVALDEKGGAKLREVVGALRAAGLAVKPSPPWEDRDGPAKDCCGAGSR